MIFDDILDKIKQSKKIAIFTHIKADGDCLGAGMALYYSIKNLNKCVDIFNAEHVHTNYNFLTKNKIKSKLNGEYDLFIAVDSATPKRLGDFGVDFSKHKNTINIDHHISNINYAMINFVNAKASSASEIIYEYLYSTKQTIDDNIAEALLSGISADTGCFKYSSTTSRTHEIASQLLKYNVDTDKIYYYLFNIQSKKEVSITSFMLQKLKYFCNDKVVITGITNKELETFNATEDDIPRIVESLSGIQGVEVAITYKQDTDNGFNVSFRSAGKVDVNIIAEGFGGGGHVMASGCKIYAKEQTVVKRLVERAGKFIIE